MITIENHKLVSTSGDLDISYETTPNHSGAFQSGLPDTIIVHYTAGSSLESSVNWLKNPKAKVSAHLVVGKSGAVVQLVPFNTIAWHAGNSEWNGRTGLNSYSIGIEMDNAGLLEKQADGYYTYFGKRIPEDQVMLATHKHSSEEAPWEVYTEAQLAVVSDICIALKEDYNIVELLGHDDIAPERKLDPGPAFPLQQLRGKVLLGRKQHRKAKPVLRKQRRIPPLELS
ncbi:MAG: N-acetylmuramoyl-L-alanine amidase [Bacteroidota bacterium]